MLQFMSHTPNIIMFLMAYTILTLDPLNALDIGAILNFNWLPA